MSAYLGIDWGTHSSKWAHQRDGLNPVVGSIWDSAVCRIDGSLTMFTADEYGSHPSREIALKRKLIQDPDQSFWEGKRPKLGVTLGEAVVFSILALLLDANRTLIEHGNLITSKQLTVRFSHPNWISEETVRAINCFRDAAVVALAVLAEGIEHSATNTSVSIPAEKIQEGVRRHRPFAERLPQFPALYSHDEYQQCSKGRLDNITWEFIFESCAAGFPYLVENERALFEDTVRSFPANRRVRKILVIDVGAGSTDAGYLVRTVRPRDQEKIMHPLLIWLPAADALELAGRWLTDRIHNDLKQQGRRVTDVEAEDFKLSQHDAWVGKPYVREWSSRIGDHVGEYARGIRDEICLPKPPDLEIVVTGGSSAVRPMKEAVASSIEKALRERRMRSSIKLIQPETYQLQRSGYREVQLAQLAVALGASDPLLSELKAYPKGLA